VLPIRHCIIDRSHGGLRARYVRLWQYWRCPQPRPTIFGPREELVPQFISGQNFLSRTHDYAILYPWNQRLVLIAVHL